ncbi:MAG: archaetidylserine decarboxylase [Candidatus Thiodiazotropha sp.]
MTESTSSPQSFPQKLLETLFIVLQYLLPHHLLSRLMHSLARIETPAVKDLLIHQVVKWYGVDMQEALESDPSRYRSFNDFFTRALRPDARPVTQQDNEIACPADGAISQLGEIEAGYLFQAKGHDFSLLELLGGDLEMAGLFDEGAFATVYLSPRDYHRLHMPLDGQLKKMLHVPGRLFSVNDTTARRVPRLFARNERVVCLFETPNGPMAMILVGAIFVSSIETVWAGAVTPVRERISSWDYAPDAGPKPVELSKGEEMGRFNMGSTVILLFGKDRVDWLEGLAAGTQVRMGEAIGVMT